MGATPEIRATRGVLARASAGLLVLGVALSACETPPPAAGPSVFTRLEVAATLELLRPEPGLAGVFWAIVRIAPADGLPLMVGPVRDGDRPAGVELNVSWRDHSGERPLAVGQRLGALVAFYEAQSASVERPAEVALRVELDVDPAALARRVEVTGRLIGLEVWRGDGVRSGGRMLVLPEASLVTLARAPAADLPTSLQSGAPEGIFLAAAAAPAGEREEVLGLLVGALPSAAPAARDAIFAALLFLTGETHGRDIHLWRTWWSERSRTAVDGVPSSPS